ncbi:hypothetical protein Tco_0945953 [Tanacetum coccineum]
MKDAISLIGSSKDIFRLTTNEMSQPPTEPSRQEEFEHIVMNFIYDQEERIKQLENYMQDITNEFMEFSLEVALRLKERVKENKSRPQKIEKITKYPDTKDLENSARHNFLENLEKKMFSTPASHLCKVRRLGVFDDGVHQMHFETLARRRIHSRDVIDWEFLAHHNLEQEFFNSISTDPFTGPQWGNLFRINEPIYRELIWGEQREISLLEFGWRISLYSQGQSIENTTLCRLRDCNTVREDRLLMEFWPRIGNAMAEEEENDEADDEGDKGARGDAGQGEAGGSADLYRNMSQVDWQAHQAHWMGQQDKR